VEITLTDGTVIVDVLAVADAHPLGAKPFSREQYIGKFCTLADGVLEQTEIERFLELVQRLPHLAADELSGLTVTAKPGLFASLTTPKGLF